MGLFERKIKVGWVVLKVLVRCRRRVEADQKVSLWRFFFEVMGVQWLENGRQHKAPNH
jgi:hypothetical protein